VEHGRALALPGASATLGAAQTAGASTWTDSTIAHSRGDVITVKCGATAYEAKPGHFVLVQGIERLHKQLAHGKRWILALDSNDPNYQQIRGHLQVGQSPKLHLVLLAHVLKSWEEDPGVNFASIAHLFKAKHADLRRLLRLIVSHEYSPDSHELLTLQQCTTTNIMHYLQWLDKDSKSLIAQIEKLSNNQRF
jgi:hypothetical protein